MLNSSSKPDLDVLVLLAWLEKLFLAAVAVLAGAILCLWYIPPLAAFAPPGWSKMTALAAIGMVLTTASLALSAPRRSDVAMLFGRAIAFLVLAIGILVLLTFSSGLELGIPHLLPIDPAAPDHGHPSLQTAMFFVLSGFSVAFIRQSKSSLSIAVDFCALALIVLTMFQIGNYAFRVVEVVNPSTAFKTSPQTLFCVCMLVFVITARRAIKGGILSVLVSRGMGGRAMRKLMPGILVLPFFWLLLIGFLSRPGWLAETYARAIVAPLMALMQFGVTAWLAQRTNAIERELQLQSLTDELTDVFNRRGFYAVANYAMLNAARLETGMVLFFFDLDGLKEVNDRLGHEAGSALLKRFAGILAVAFRKADVVARVGGDEFVVLATNTQDCVAADILARLAREVERSNSHNPAAGEIAYSAGSVEISNPGTAKIDHLIAQADALMYEHKQLRKRLLAAGALRVASDLAAA
jgi:diguanylate cyclase (GGDEF)-like protein